MTEYAIQPQQADEPFEVVLFPEQCNSTGWLPYGWTLGLGFIPANAIGRGMRLASQADLYTAADPVAAHAIFTVPVP